MLGRFIALILLILALMTRLAGCCMEVGRGIMKEYEENKETIKSEFYELKDSLMEEIDEFWEDVCK